VDKWFKVITTESGVFLNNYYNLGLSVQHARDRHVCASALTRSGIELLTIEEIKLLEKAESKRSNLISEARQSQWSLLPIEELKVAAKIFLKTPYRSIIPRSRCLPARHLEFISSIDRPLWFHFYYAFSSYAFILFLSPYA
jgi:hypothetical protein